MTSKRLHGKVALVSGASRGVGRGIALALGDAGATVFVTGRTKRGAQGSLPGSVEATADDVTARGGTGIAVHCDHAVDADVESVFARIDEEAGRLDILVNNAFALPDGPVFSTPFWEQPIAFWDTMHAVGLRSHYVASVFAAKRMVKAGGGLVAHVSSFGAKHYAVNVAYGVGKAGVDRLAKDMAVELKPHGVVSVALWPGIVKTERLLALGPQSPFDLSKGESAEFTGRAVVALASDPTAMTKSGKALVVADLAAEYGFTDLDGTTPRGFETR